MKKESELRRSAEALAAPLYRGELPYHNFEHAKRVAKKAEEIAARCQKEGVPVNGEVVYYAALFHDAGYQENHGEKGFVTKEDYSAFLAAEALEKLGFDKKFVEEARKAIISTRRNEVFATNEAKAVRAADLSGLAGDYETFLESNRKLKQEAELLSGSLLSWAEWKKKTEEIVEFYLVQDIRLTSAYEDKDGNSLFHEKARANLERFLREENVGA